VFLLGFPLLIVPLALYNIMTFLIPVDWQAPLTTIPMMSGGQWIISLADILLAIAIVMLMFETVKATRTSSRSIVDHMLSTLVFVAALVLCLAGDVFLMLPSDQFVFGLASFLLAHVAYTIGFHSFAVWALFVVLAAAALLAPRILRAADRELRVPVAVYMVAIVAMVTSAFSTGDALAIAGAALFFASDATIAWNRFVHEKSWAPLFIIVTYHLGQAGLVLSVVR